MQDPWLPKLTAVVIFLFLSAPSSTVAALLQVGPDRPYKTVRAASQAAQSGDTIEVDAGVYSGDVTTWPQNDITVRGVGVGRAHLRADGAQEGGKGTWVLYGHNFTAENIEFSGSHVPDQNGAGIRADGGGLLVVRNCYFHDNDEGILGGGDEVFIEYSVFDHNGFGDGQSHNMYIAEIRKFTLQYSYTHRAIIGHNVKSRARENHILYNRIMDEADGTASYSIDLPQGGRSFVIGNVVEQGPNTDNATLIAYAAENANNGVLELYVVNNTMVNNRPSGGLFLQMRAGTTARIINNVFYGPGTPWSSGSSVTSASNYFEADYNNSIAFRNPAAYDFHLTSSSPAGAGGVVNAGTPPGTSSTGVELTPVLQYVYDAQREPRSSSGGIDIGAFELSIAVGIPPAAPANVRVR